MTIDPHPGGPGTGSPAESGAVVRHGVMRRLHGSQPDRKAVRVLAIDGGGIRGIIPAVVLGEIERRTGRHPSELFDVFAGTSTGSILAMGLAVPADEGGPRHPAAMAADAYEEYAPRIFPRARLPQLRGLVHEKYPSAGIEATLEEMLGDARMSDALVHTLVPVYDLYRQDIHVFDTVRAGAGQQDDLLMRQVVRGATAAPTYFDPLPVESADAGGRRLLVDGGLFANNPGMLAFTEVGRHHAGADVVMVSLGTGDADGPVGIREAHDWGLAQWARPLLHMVANSAAQTTDHELMHLLGTERYFRFQTRLPEAGDLDDVTPANLRRLRRVGEQLVDTMSAELDQACELLAR